MASYKNILQEYCIAHGMAYPVYRTRQTEESVPHQPVWECSVVLETGVRYTCKPVRGKKIDAEKEAAQYALEKLQLFEHAKPSVELVFPVPVAVFVDVENQPQAILQLLEHETRNLTVFGFYASSASQARKAKTVNASTEDPRVRLIEVPSTRPHAAEMGLMLFLGAYLAAQSDPPHVVIVSNDRFADAVVDCLAGGIEGPVRKEHVSGAYVCHHCEELEKCIQTLVLG